MLAWTSPFLVGLVSAEPVAHASTANARARGAKKVNTAAAAGELRHLNHESL
jgi:hypothetical protein